MTDPATSAKIELARDSLAAKLVELQRRATHARAMLSPSTYLASPVVRFGLALAAGYLLGSRTEGAAAERSPPGSLEVIVRASLAAAAAGLVRRLLEAPVPA